MHLTPIQKLVRLKELTRLILAAPPFRPNEEAPAAAMAALKERDEILATVGAPPAEILDDLRPVSWATAFAEAFPSVDYETALEWFGLAIHAAWNGGRAEGYTSGQVEGSTAKAEDLLETLKLIRDGLACGAVTAKTIQAPDGTPRKLVERIVEDLARWGITQ